MLARLLLCALLLTGCGGLSPPEPEGPLTGDRLVAALREGGLVLYLRHTATTDSGTDDLARPEACEGQRSLTEEGRADAREIGAAVETLGVPIGPVVASPICRTKETAVLAFGDAVTDRALLPVDGETPEQQLTAGRRLLAAQPPDGTNTVLVGHISNVRALSGAEPREGGTIVFRPHGDGDFRIVGQLPPQGWQHLAARR